MSSLIGDARRFANAVKRLERAVRADALAGSLTKTEREEAKRELRDARKAVYRSVER